MSITLCVASSVANENDVIMIIAGSWRYVIGDMWPPVARL